MTKELARKKPIDPQQTASLKGKIILVTRQREQSADLIERIASHQGVAVVIPMIRILEPVSWEPCDSAIQRIDHFDSVVFTSANAVEKFFRRCEVKGVFSSAFERMNIYSVGEKTNEMLWRYGIRVSLSPKDFSSAALQEVFQQENVSKRHFLLPIGNLSRHELASRLRSLGADVAEVQVYQNAPPSTETVKELRARFLQREFDVVTFASPSAVTNFSEAVAPGMFPLIRNQTKIAVIGATTRTAAEQHGYLVDIEARESTRNGLVDAILKYYS